MTPALAYWGLVALIALLIVCLGIVAWQRDTARTAVDLYRDALLRADPHEARVVAETIHPGSTTQIDRLDP